MNVGVGPWTGEEIAPTARRRARLQTVSIKAMESEADARAMSAVAGQTRSGSSNFTASWTGVDPELPFRIGPTKGR